MVAGADPETVLAGAVLLVRAPEEVVELAVELVTITPKDDVVVVRLVEVLQKLRFRIASSIRKFSKSHVTAVVFTVPADEDAADDEVDDVDWALSLAGPAMKNVAEEAKTSSILPMLTNSITY